MLKIAQAIRSENLRVPGQTGQVTCIQVEHVFNEATANGDFLEISGIPAYCKVLSLTVSAENVAGTHDLVVLAGLSGAIDQDRISAANVAAQGVIENVDTTAETSIEQIKLLDLGVADYDRGIALALAAAQGASATRRVVVTITYMQ